MTKLKAKLNQKIIFTEGNKGGVGTVMGYDIHDKSYLVKLDMEQTTVEGWIGSSVYLDRDTHLNMIFSSKLPTEDLNGRYWFVHDDLINLVYRVDLDSNETDVDKVDLGSLESIIKYLFKNVTQQPKDQESEFTEYQLEIIENLQSSMKKVDCMLGGFIQIDNEMRKRAVNDVKSYEESIGHPQPQEFWDKLLEIVSK